MYIRSLSLQQIVILDSLKLVIQIPPITRRVFIGTVLQFGNPCRQIYLRATVKM